MNYVVCLKHGTKYSADYVNKLFNMVKRNTTVPYEFVCFTENKKGLNPDIRVIDLFLHPNISGWWYKTYFFNPHLPLKGTILYFDLDVIIFNNIDNLFTYKENEFCIIRDFNRHVRPNWDRMNSSVFRLNTGDQLQVYEDYIKDPSLAKKFHGDQDWIFAKVKDRFNFWPDEWIQSYKWEMRDRTQLRLINGRRNFIDVAIPNVKEQTSIAVFHGDPNPADCKDPWVQKYWA